MKKLTLTMMALSLLSACSDDENIAVDDPAGVFTPAQTVAFDDIIPDVVSFGTVSGDREKGAHGTFVRIPPGKETPLHTHGAAYEAVIVQGILENPIPGVNQSAVELDAGSYYNVPAGAKHITRCADSSPVDCISYFYQMVPFDFSVADNEFPVVQGSEQAKFTLAADIMFDDIIPGVVAFGTASGNRENGAHGTFVRIPPGEATPLHTHSASYQAVVIQGILENPIPEDRASDLGLTTGSYYSVPANAKHVTRCSAASTVDCISYFYQNVAFDFAVAQD